MANMCFGDVEKLGNNRTEETSLVTPTPRLVTHHKQISKTPPYISPKSVVN